jgi:hypothetical protein
MASAALAPIAEEELSQPVESITITQQEIAQRAYKIWEREGKVTGRDQEHWFQAIVELTAETVDDGDDDEDDADAVSVIPQTVRTPLVTSTARRSHYSV